MARDFPVLHREGVGSYLTLTLDVPFDPALRALAEQHGVDAAPLSLQTLVVRAGVLDRPIAGAVA